MFMESPDLSLSVCGCEIVASEFFISRIGPPRLFLAARNLINFLIVLLMVKFV